jgi:fructose-bisphosphate aldolase class II
VPQDLLAEIREFGGDMKETYGVPVEEIQEGIKHGVRKVNIDTDIRLAMTGATRNAYPLEVRPARIPQARDERRQGRLQAALRAVRLRGHGVEDQGAAPRQDGREIQVRRAAAGRELTPAGGAP